jgi:cysteine sulfinate desulfinase/cysteine desulfurase-like protein
LVGQSFQRLPNTGNIVFEGIEAEAILHQLDQPGICVSSGSACTTGPLAPSHVLTAMGIKLMRARGCGRISLGIYNTDEEVDYLLKHLPGVIARLREESPHKPATTHAAPAEHEYRMSRVWQQSCNQTRKLGSGAKSLLASFCV